ncbi:MAG: haloacid dehalogenase-like hydrolase [Muribaculaceae bacterium]|nr:haloacid dehalogenase-like hydrolase [Muribaculaceae bacterium]MDE6644248.1 haloacid dehalogenase-like hydrolase [Muribaculaceae bacterium]
MGDRCKVAVFDLDGTLIKGSSFNRFIWFLLKKLIKSGRYTACYVVLYYFILQVLRISSRATAKFEIMHIADGFLTQNDYLVFANQIARSSRCNLLSQLHDFQSNNTITVLLSASPDQYVSQIASILKFDYAAGSISTSDLKIYQETRGERKVQILNDLISENSKIEYIFTDHQEDFYLIDSYKDAKIILVNPSLRLKSLCDKARIDYKLNIQHD